jgi:flavin-dependent dehydrogenase
MSIGAKLTPHRHGQALRFLRGLSPTPDYHVTYRPLCSNRVPNHLVPRNMFLLGDAAGLVDPLTGEGISYALESGFLAANCLSHSPDPTEARQRYEILLRSRYSLLRLVSRMGYQFAKSTELTEIGSRMMGSEIWASFAARWFGQGTPLPF